jgi:hypothetical protein
MIFYQCADFVIKRKVVRACLTARLIDSVIGGNSVLCDEMKSHVINSELKSWLGIYKDSLIKLKCRWQITK